MIFHEVRFPAAISFGSTGGIERRTEVVRLVSGHEERNTPWAHSRRRYDAGLGVRAIDDIDEIIAFFEARRGMLHAFRWKDWLDHKSGAPSATISAMDQEVGVGDGITSSFQLTKTYSPGPHAYRREIRKPVAGSVTLAVDGIVQAEGNDFMVDVQTGILTVAQAPSPGASVTAGFEFDVPVRFDTDTIEINLAAFEAGEIPSIPVIEVRIR